MDHLIRTINERILERMEDGEELKFCFFCPTGVLYYTRKAGSTKKRAKDGGLYHRPGKDILGCCTIFKAVRDRGVFLS